MSYKLVETDDRIAALDDNGDEICGAYKPVGHDYWIMFVTKLITAVTNLDTPPHREYWGEHGRIGARSWMEMVAKLYCMITEHENGVT